MARPIQQAWDIVALDEGAPRAPVPGTPVPSARAEHFADEGMPSHESVAPSSAGHGLDDRVAPKESGPNFGEELEAPGLAEELEAPGLAEELEAPSLAEELEDVAVDAFDAADADELMAALLGGVRDLTRRLARSARARGFDATVSDGATSGGLLGRLRNLGACLERCAREGATEPDAFDAIASLYVERGADEALPALAVIAARALVRPPPGRTQRRRNPSLARPLVSASVRAARRLTESHGRAAVHALPRLALRVGRQALERGSRPAELRGALSRAVAQLLERPELLERLARVEPRAPRDERAELADAPRSSAAAPPRDAAPSAAAAAPSEAAAVIDAGPSDAEGRPARAARRIRVQGPVEIVIYER